MTGRTIGSRVFLLALVKQYMEQKKYAQASMSAQDYPRAYRGLLATIKLVPGHYPAPTEAAP